MSQQASGVAQSLNPPPESFATGTTPKGKRPGEDFCCHVRKPGLYSLLLHIEKLQDATRGCLLAQNAGGK